MFRTSRLLLTVVSAFCSSKVLGSVVTFFPQNSADSCNLPEGSTSDLLNARLSGELVSLALIRYQGHDWHGHFRIQQEMPEFFDVCLTCESTTNVTVDVSLHVRRTENCLLLSLFSPYWIINKTSRVLQYQAENVTVKHPGDYRDVILFSFRRKKLFTENQVRDLQQILASSGVVWEMKPKNRWKPFSQKNIELLEKAYQLNSTDLTCCLWFVYQVNLSRAGMMMRKPYSCPIRRTFQPGIYMELKQSLHQRSLRAQLHWLQVDNQLPGAMFPIVFHPVPPPNTMLKRHPFLVTNSEVTTMFVFQSGLIEADLQGLQAELMEASLSETSGLSFFEYFHISPIKLHLSLSLDSSSNSMDQETAALQSLNLLLKSIGATLTDVDDVIFKLAFFEVKYQFYRREELMKEAARHYGEQFLKQMYVLVLGLDVLGNPFGLIRGLSEGVEAFFYEPFQGAVQGPEEFAEGFAIGVRSLLGHTVGGAAGMVSKITGSMGKGLAAITMDKEFQQKRREEMNRQPKDFSDSLAKGGKGLLKGVVGGVTGIVTKPVEGAKKEGAAGFFKGIGRGLVGIVARPTGGLVDMASSTFQGIQRAAEATEEVTKLRPPRLIKEDGIIRPYDLTESQGFDLFQV
uniref:VP13C protein n=1 Tax=Oryzias sinensis TaxID=183150 RepID=A0A8C7WR68_9TELE